MCSRLLHVLIPALGVAGSDLIAQESAGPFAGLPAAIGVDPVLNPAGPSQSTTFEKRPGFAGAALAGFGGYDLGSILAGFNVSNVDVDDFSIGQDWIEVDDQTGFVQVPTNQWAALTFSVTRTTQGAPRSPIAAERLADGNAGSAVFSYLFPGSAVPTELVGRVQRAHSRRELGVPVLRDVDGLDHLLPMVRLQPQVRNLMGQITVYFTVASGSVNNVPAPWWNGTTPSGATIFATTAVAGQTWQQPQPFLTHADLQLAATEDIDGLAIDLPNQRILFSTRRGTPDPLLFAYFGTDQVQPVPLMENDGTPNGTPVSTKIGLVTSDDVDAICASDPSVRVNGSTPNAFYFHCGTPRPTALGPVGSMSGSACRDHVGNQVLVHTWLTGWPPQTGPGPGFAVLFLSFGTNTTPAFPMGPLFVRNPANPIDGDPQQFTIPIPANITLGSTPVTLRWFATDAGFTELAEAWPVFVRI